MNPPNQDIYATTGGKPVEGAWYQGRRYLGGQLLNPGEYEPGKMTSPDVIAQTNPANVAYIQQQRQQMGLTPAPQNAPSTPTTGFAGGAVSMPTAPSIDLPGLYKSYSEQAGISTLQKSINDKTAAYNTNLSKINDNPYLSEADRTGRAEKLRIDYTNDVKKDQDMLAMKKADIETQINLQAKQFDINSEAAKTAFSQFNSLLSSGALDNASGTDIASITSSTGIPSSMIQSAISARKEKGVTIHSYDDGTKQGFVAIDKEGNIVKKSEVANSKPKAIDVKKDIQSSYSDYTSNKVVTINGRTGPVQQLLSPEDFVKLMKKKFPTEADDLTSAGDIRKITGQ